MEEEISRIAKKIMMNNNVWCGQGSCPAIYQNFLGSRSNLGNMELPHWKTELKPKNLYLIDSLYKDHREHRGITEGTPGKEETIQ